MHLTAEIRWFGQGPLPAAWLDWFDRAGAALDDGDLSEHLYLRDPGQAELGIKRRQGRAGTEIKGLVMANWAALDVAPFHGDIELWSKWSSQAVSFDAGELVAVHKRRWLRQYGWQDGQVQAMDEVDRPGTLACQVELSDLRREQRPWWTLSFEASGDLSVLTPLLRAVAGHLARRHPPSLDHTLCLGYPAWLCQSAG